MDLRVPDGDGPFAVILYGDRFGGPAIREAARSYAVAIVDARHRRDDAPPRRSRVAMMCR